jgi:trehalose synthase
VVDADLLASIRELAEPLRDARVVHINATAYGGGVAEILNTLVPLTNAVGLSAEWQIIEGDEPFFDVTKACHNGLQGMDIPFTEEMQNIWRRYNEMNAERFEGEYDFVVVHDPQPVGLRHYTGGHGGKHWLWRCHIDTSQPNPDYWHFFTPYIHEYEVGIFTMPQYVKADLNLPHVAIIAPTIDPLSPKNAPFSDAQVIEIISLMGIDTARPLITQVSRFDPWKDQIGVIDAYRMVKEQVPGVQLALIGSMAADDPEGWEYVEKARAHAGDDPDIHIWQNLDDMEVAAVQAASTVVLQKSLREGFGLTVSEAMWKGRPVVGGNAGGIPLQIVDGETGFLVNSVDECADRVTYLLQHPEEARQMGATGIRHVERNFVVTRLLADYLQLFAALAGEKLHATTGDTTWAAPQ